MNIIYVVIAGLVIPVFFFMLTWVAVTAYRLLFPEEPLAPQKDPVVVRRVAAARGESVPVGAREIREDQRHSFSEQAPASYTYAYGESEGFPEKWREDLSRRQN